jgi:hypothetical protein
MSFMPRRSGLKDLLLYLAFVAAVLAFFFAISGTKAPRIPADPQHPAGALETECVACHGAYKDHPLPEKHPPKEKCLSCHKRAKR